MIKKVDKYTISNGFRKFYDTKEELINGIMGFELENIKWHYPYSTVLKVFDRLKVEIEREVIKEIECVIMYETDDKHTFSTEKDAQNHEYERYIDKKMQMFGEYKRLNCDGQEDVCKFLVKNVVRVIEALTDLKKQMNV